MRPTVSFGTTRGRTDRLLAGYATASFAFGVALVIVDIFMWINDLGPLTVEAFTTSWITLDRSAETGAAVQLSEPASDTPGSCRTGSSPSAPTRTSRLPRSRRSAGPRGMEPLKPDERSTTSRDTEGHRDPTDHHKPV
jgi:hypothetical protein